MYMPSSLQQLTFGSDVCVRAESWPCTFGLRRLSQRRTSTYGSIVAGSRADILVDPPLHEPSRFLRTHALKDIVDDNIDQAICSVCRPIQDIRKRHENTTLVQLSVSLVQEPMCRRTTMCKLHTPHLPRLSAVPLAGRDTTPVRRGHRLWFPMRGTPSRGVSSSRSLSRDMCIDH